MRIIEGLNLLAKYDLKMFDDGNWDCNAGATSINSLIDPFYGEINHEDFAMTIIVDKEGISIDFYEDPETIDNFATFSRENTFENSLRILGIFTFYNRTKDEVLFILDNFFISI